MGILKLHADKTFASLAQYLALVRKRGHGRVGTGYTGCLVATQCTHWSQRLWTGFPKGRRLKGSHWTSMQVETTHEVLKGQCREPGQQVRLPRWQAVWGGGHLPLMGPLMCSPCAGWEMKDPEALAGGRGSELWRRAHQGPSAHTLLGSGHSAITAAGPGPRHPLKGPGAS